MGSGDLIKLALEKYPLSCFSKEFLFNFDNFEDMNAKEKELVPLSACTPNNPLSYNIKEGGNTGKLNTLSIEKIRNSAKGKIFSKEHKQKISNAHKGKPSSFL
jgi:hypothetical protein